MGEFLAALTDPGFPFLRHALLAGLLGSVAFGIVGTYVVARRITYVAAAISHSVLGGVGAALYLQVAWGLAWCKPLYGAVVVALGAALLIGWISLRGREREDTVIGAIWAIGMAVGLLFFQATPGRIDPMGYLFGDILLVTRGDLWLVAGLDLLVVALGVGLYPRWMAVCFDEDFARSRGVRVEAHYLLLLCVTALTVVLLINIVGIVLAIALLTLPAAVAGRFSRRLWQMMALAVMCCMLFVALGLVLCYRLNLPAGPSIICVAGAAYLLQHAAGALRPLRNMIGGLLLQNRQGGGS